jgi:hypothetical protein
MEKYCYVVTSHDGNPYDIGVCMSFESLIKYFKTVEKWKISNSITLDELINMGERVFISISKMKVLE